MERHLLTIAEMSALIQRRELSPVELVEGLLDRIHALDSQINAFITITFVPGRGGTWTDVAIDMSGVALVALARSGRVEQGVLIVSGVREDGFREILCPLCGGCRHRERGHLPGRPALPIRRSSSPHLRQRARRVCGVSP